MTKGPVISGLVILALAFLSYSALFTINQAEQALVLQFGDPKRVITEPGLKMKLPFIQEVARYDKRVLDYDAPAEEVIAEDQKRLVVDVFVRYRITDPLKFRQTVRRELLLRDRLKSMTSNAMRGVVGKVQMLDLLSEKRTGIMHDIRDVMNAEGGSFGIEVIDVRARRADLPEANSEAIYNRMKSEREREAKEFRAQGAEAAQRIRSLAERNRTVLLAEARKTGEILRGEGDSQSIKIYAEAFGKDVDFFSFYRSMEAYRKSLSGDGTTMVLSPDSEFFRYFKEFSGKK
ncbi:MAG: HflC protein [Rhodospirillaceae bacterium]|jgi:membrane protease subunit HflC|nr:HflC protein [Rhodospirillaceae bacterium]MDP6031266.1 protease modulator HflC [Alphaproteobacteria bacterium]HJO88759.1 protease modulator HflC [Alphaproteobacteria bacterium]|tara:strand:+ start:477 stop:1346 length:870 start_codon:yes stop_codon:yes gene_type:complete